MEAVEKRLTDHQTIHYLSEDLKECIIYFCFDKNLEHPFVLKNSQVGERIYIEMMEDETMEITEFPYEVCVHFVSEKPFYYIYVYRDGDVFSSFGQGAEPPY